MKIPVYISNTDTILVSMSNGIQLSVYKNYQGNIEQISLVCGIANLIKPQTFFDLLYVHGYIVEVYKSSYWGSNGPGALLSYALSQKGTDYVKLKYPS